MPNEQLRDKVALITGASRGIGLAIARRYLDEGGKVVLVARKLEGLEQARKELDADDQVEIAAAHVGDPSALEAAVGKGVDRFGRLDILVNNAGTNPHFGPILTSKDSQWQKTLDVNVFGAFRLAKLAVPEMRKVGGGQDHQHGVHRGPPTASGSRALLCHQGGLGDAHQRARL